MSSSRRRPGKTGLLRGWPLGWRLPLSICGVLIIALEVFLGVAFRRVEQTLADAGSTRARAAATQLASVFERSARASRDDIRRLSLNPDVRQFVIDPNDDNRAAVSRLFSTSGAGDRRIEVWTEGGQRIFELTRDDSATLTPRLLPPGEWPLMPGLSPFRIANDFVYFDNVEEIRSSAVPAAQRLGYLLIRSTPVVNQAGTLGELVGNNAHVLIGNEQGNAWSDLAHLVSPPPFASARDGVLEYQTPDNGSLLAGAARVRDTPWGVWIEFSRAEVVAPAVRFNQQMTVAALLVAIAAAFLVRGLTGRLTTPLTSLAGAAEAMAGGDYGRRVGKFALWPELTRLGEAFNVMATNVETTHRTLEGQINERTSALEALRVSEARYRAIIDVALDSIMTIDDNGVVQEFNPAAERTFGYRRHEAVGRELATLIIPPHFRLAHRQGLQIYSESGVGPVIGRLIEMTAMRSDGSEFPVEIAITGVDTEGGKRLFTGVVRDITQRKRSEAALVESERAFRSTFDEAPLGIAQISVDGRWLRVNRQVSTLFGYEPDELLGGAFADLFVDPLDDGSDWSDILSEGTSNPAQERRGWRKDGQSVWVNLTISAHNDETGAPIYFIVIIEDTTDRRRLEERLRQSQKMEAIGQLAGGISHDFNNMLTAILGYAYFLADEFPPEDPRRKDVEEIVRAGERSAALTRQLLAFSRKQILQPAVLNLNILVTDTADMLRRVIGEHIQLETQLAPDLHPVCADPTQLEQIVMNLAVNARDAMPTGGRLTIETENVTFATGLPDRPGAIAPGTYVRLSVTDNGFGIDDDTKRRLFEPFFTTKDQGEGTGLGLATVYGIVKQSGGHIAVDSEPLQGASFQVYLPAVLDVSDIPIRPTGTFPAARGTETILLVEDERSVRTLTRAILERGGYTVLDAAAPEEALDVFLEHRDGIQLLVSDVVMPGSSGPGLYERLTALHPSLRVLFMSGYTDDEVVRAGRGEANIEFIEKPFTAIRLMQKVRDVLDRRPA